MLIDYEEVLFERISKLIKVEEYFLEVLLDQCDDAHQLDVSQAGAHEESNRVVLIPDQQGKLDAVLGHCLKTLATAARLLRLKLYLPMGHHTLDDEVKAYKEVDEMLPLFVVLKVVEALGELGHLQYLR